MTTAASEVPLQSYDPVGRDAGGGCPADLMDLIYDGPLESPPWQRLLWRLREITNATRCSLQLHRADTTEADVRIEATHPLSKTDWQELKERYRSRYMHSDPINIYRLMPGQIAVYDECRGCLNHSELLEPEGITHLVRACAAETGGMRCWVECVGQRDLGPFDQARDVALLRQLLPHLSRALKLYSKLMLEHSEKAIYESAIGQLAFGTLLLDGAGRLLDANAMAREMMGRHPEIMLRNDALCLADEACDHELRGAIAAAIELRQRPGSQRSAELVRVRSDSGALLGLLVVSAPVLAFYRGAQAPNVIIYMSDLERRLGEFAPQRESAEQLVGKLFSLSRTEAKLAVLLADGLDMPAAAAEMGITEGTARNYSKRIYEKTGIRRQLDLIRSIYKSVALLG